MRGSGASGWLVPFLVALGFSMVSAGVGMVYLPAGVITGGVLLVVVAAILILGERTE